MKRDKVDTEMMFDKNGVKFLVGTNFNDVVATFKEYAKDEDTNVVQVQIWKDNKENEYLGIALGGGMGFGMETTKEDVNSIKDWWGEEWIESFEDELKILLCQQ